MNPPLWDDGIRYSASFSYFILIFLAEVRGDKMFKWRENEKQIKTREGLVPKKQRSKINTLWTLSISSCFYDQELNGENKATRILTLETSCVFHCPPPIWWLALTNIAAIGDHTTAWINFIGWRLWNDL